MILKARVSSHSPASHSATMALVQTSLTTAAAPSPARQNMSVGTHGNVPPSGAGSVGKAHTGVAKTTAVSETPAVSPRTTIARGSNDRICRERCGLDMAEVPIADVDREIGVGPHRGGLCWFVARPDPAVDVPHHPLTVGGRHAGGLLQGHVELEV